MVKYCSKCGAELKDSAIYCDECGTKQDKTTSKFNLKKYFKQNKYALYGLLIIIILIFIIGSVILINTHHKPVVYSNTINGVGTFNSTNVTNFTLNSQDTNEYQTFYTANDTITEVTVLTSTSRLEVTIGQSTKVNDSAKGNTIYKGTSNIGEHKGEIRYWAYLNDGDNKRYITFSSPSYDLTCMMIDSFKFLN